jgi:hypothetical protein
MACRMVPFSKLNASTVVDSFPAVSFSPLTMEVTGSVYHVW